MDNFLDTIYYDLNKLEGSLVNLKTWSQKFWKIKEEDFPAISSQKGYEDKGFGHIKAIISNTSSLLESYYQKVSDINIWSKDSKINDTFYKQYLRQLEPTLLLFYCAAHLHDVGMNYAGFYRALSPLLKAGGSTAIHIGAIIHDYHQYTILILLLDLLNGVQWKIGNTEGTKKYVFIAFNWSKTVFLKQLNLTEEEEEEETKRLGEMVEAIANIYRVYFKSNFSNLIKEPRDFFTILAILCFLHKEYDLDFLQSILQKFNYISPETVDCFNRWWDFFIRAKEWTQKTWKNFPDFKKDSEPFSGWEQILLKSEKENSSTKSTDAQSTYLNLHLAAALLQYGDQTEISIARMAREIQCQNNKSICPLDQYLEDIVHDNKIGYIEEDMAQRKISSWARFRASRFLPVAQITVKDENSKTKRDIDITIHYLRFPNDDKEFRMLRYHNEKDFYDMESLNSLHIHLPMMLYSDSVKLVDEFIVNFILRRKEFDIMDLLDETEDQIEKRFPHNHGAIFSLLYRYKEQMSIPGENRFPYTRQNKKAIRKLSPQLGNPEARHRAQGMKEVFYKTGDLLVPSGFEVMAVLNLFHQED